MAERSQRRPSAVLGIEHRGGWVCYQIDMICYLALDGYFDPPKLEAEPSENGHGRAPRGAGGGGGATRTLFDIPVPQYASILNRAPVEGRKVTIRPQQPPAATSE